MSKVKDLLHEAREQYRTLKCRTPTVRRQWLSDLKDDPNLTKTERKQIRTIMHTEDSRDTARKIRKVKNEIQGKSITNIEVTTGDETITHTDKAACKEAISTMVSE